MSRYGDYYGFKPYVRVADRHKNAAKKTAALQKKGRVITPVKINGRKIAATFWGLAWCDNMENYSDFANRLPRGRTYVRNGSVVDLQIKPGRVTALVSGSELYEIEIQFERCQKPRWNSIRSLCAGKIGSLIELLQGKLSAAIMQIITSPDSGLFPKPKEIKLDCSCPDGAYLCKHLAAVLYGIGARLDSQPELLFTLRQVDHLDLIARAADMTNLVQAAPTGHKTLAPNDLADVFGIEIEPAQPAAAPKQKKSIRTAKSPAPKNIPPPKSPAMIVQCPRV